MSKLLLIYHSQSNKVEHMAGAVRRGIEKEQVELRYLQAFDADENDLLWCDGLLIGSPENFGYMAGAIKDFFDRTYYQVLAQQLNIPYGIFIGAGNDGRGAAREIQRIAKGYPMRLVAEPLIINQALDEDGLQCCEDLGQALAAGLVMGIF